MTRYRKSLSERESRVLSELSYRNKQIFVRGDIEEIVDDPRNFLHHLVEKNWIIRAKNGIYVIAPLEAGIKGSAAHTVHSFAIASVFKRPCYIGYWSALNYHGLTEQVSPAVHVAVTEPRHSAEILGTRFVFVKTSRRKMFGTSEMDIEGRKVAISSPEKTVIDCLDHPEYCNGVEEVARSLYFSKDEIDTSRVVSYAGITGNSAVIKRLGYITETFGWSDYSKALAGLKIGSGYSLLDPTRKHKGHIKEHWKLIVNIPIDPVKWAQ